MTEEVINHKIAMHFTCKMLEKAEPVINCQETKDYISDIFYKEVQNIIRETREVKDSLIDQYQRAHEDVMKNKITTSFPVCVICMKKINSSKEQL